MRKTYSSATPPHSLFLGRLCCAEFVIAPVTDPKGLCRDLWEEEALGGTATTHHRATLPAVVLGGNEGGRGGEEEGRAGRGEGGEREGRGGERRRQGSYRKRPDNVIHISQCQEDTQWSMYISSPSSC